MIAALQPRDSEAGAHNTRAYEIAYQLCSAYDFHQALTSLSPKHKGKGTRKMLNPSAIRIKKIRRRS